MFDSRHPLRSTFTSRRPSCREGRSIRGRRAGAQWRSGTGGTSQPIAPAARRPVPVETQRLLIRISAALCLTSGTGGMLVGGLVGDDLRNARRPHPGIRGRTGDGPRLPPGVGIVGTLHAVVRNRRLRRPGRQRGARRDRAVHGWAAVRGRLDRVRRAHGARVLLVARARTRSASSASSVSRTASCSRPMATTPRPSPSGCT